MPRPQGYLALVLHAHLPFVRHPEHDDCLEERWFFEAVMESYIPLLLRLEELKAEHIPFRLTLSLSPTLVAMLRDPLLQYRFLRRLEALADFGDREIKRTKATAFGPVARYYQKRFRRILKYYQECGRDIIQPLLALEKEGFIEIIATAATHGYLPLLRFNPASIRTQIALGVETIANLIRHRPRGFWLPECGYTEGVEEILRDGGDVAYSILETHGITRATPMPPHGVYAPILSPSGVVFFGRDPESSREVWSAHDGYPGDGEYREFYRDIAYDLDAEALGEVLHPLGIRTDTGFKYYRITGKKSVRKDMYHPERAASKARMHALDFLTRKARQVRELAAVMKTPPVVVAPFDAELFGHWWFEGPDWLYHLMKCMRTVPELEAVTLSEYLDRHPASWMAEPCESSWGGQGFHETWLNERTDWMYPLLDDGAGSLENTLCQQRPQNELARRACNQALRELLLAQASDWAFMISNGTTDRYAGERVREHLGRLRRLIRDIESGTIDERRLAAIECRDNIFPELRYEAFSNTSQLRETLPQN